jgi:ribonuclease BN (tRNA processing enzyme)
MRPGTRTMAAVTLDFIGCGDAFASGGRFQTCFLVRGTGRPCLIDCGASAPVALQQRGVDPAGIGLVLVSHLHGDHAGGLPFLLLDAAYNRARAAPLVVAGPPGVEACVLGMLDMLYPGTREAVHARVPVRFLELEPQRATDVDDVRVTAYEVRHSPKTPCLGLRLEVDGKVIAYSGDTQWTPALVELARGADLFVCECTAFDEPLYSHLSHAELSAHASELGGVRMVLTHLGPDMLRHRGETRWPCAEDGLVIEV